MLLPFVTSFGYGGNGWSLGLFAAMLSPLVLALLITVARATILRPYNPNDDYETIRTHMAHILYMHQILIEETRGTFERRLSERQERHRGDAGEDRPELPAAAGDAGAGGREVRGGRGGGQSGVGSSVLGDLDAVA